MSVILRALSYAFYVYLLLLLARFVIDWIRMFARSWRPTGVAAIGIEMVFMGTDPPVRLFRRLIPPVRLGNFSLDISLWILLIVLYIGYRLSYSYSVG